MGINSIVPTGLYPCIPSIPALKCRAKFIPSLMGRIAVQKMYKLQGRVSRPVRLFSPVIARVGRVLRPVRLFSPVIARVGRLWRAVPT